VPRKVKTEQKVHHKKYKKEDWSVIRKNSLLFWAKGSKHRGKQAEIEG